MLALKELAYRDDFWKIYFVFLIKLFVFEQTESTKEGHWLVSHLYCFWVKHFFVSVYHRFYQWNKGFKTGFIPHP